MKQLLLFLSASLLSLVVAAQPGLRILDQYDNDVTGKTITVYHSSPLAEVLEAHLKVENTGDTDLDVFLRRVNNNVVSTSTNSFCFGVNCYPPNVDTSQDVTRIQVGNINSSFLGDYYPNGGRGISSVTYEFYDNTTFATKVSASVTILYAVADVIDLFDEEGHTVNNSVINVHTTDTSSAAYLDAKVKVKNNTSQELFMFARRITNVAVPGTMNTFCYGVCYPPFVDTSFVVVSIPGGAVDSNFVADYTPSGQGGTTSLTYEFYDLYSLGSPVTATVTIEFSLSGVGIPENSTLVFDGPAPNPAQDYTTFTYDLPVSARSASLVIRNLLGAVVDHVILDRESGKAIVNTASLPSGIYLYSLLIDNKVSFTNKLIVRH
ncbi:MAG: T9SS type A sorting domain-containing protein [Bacteroidales bacterium]|nr:T9SS type A sorting domain-containing protein [Bacteroidales bacterium]